MTTINNKHKDLGIVTEKESVATVDLDEVSMFFKSTNNDDEDEEVVVLYLKSGESLEVKELYKNVKKLICP